MSGADFRHARALLGLTQRALAEALGLHWNTVARIERGEIRVTRHVAAALRLLLAAR